MDCNYLLIACPLLFKPARLLLELFYFVWVLESIAAGHLDLLPVGSQMDLHQTHGMRYY